MAVIAWTVIAVAYFVGIPLFLALPRIGDHGMKWWEPLIGWLFLNSMVALLGVLAWAACYVTGGA